MLHGSLQQLISLSDATILLTVRIVSDSLRTPGWYFLMMSSTELPRAAVLAYTVEEGEAEFIEKELVG